jgi:hypothetical protein
VSSSSAGNLQALVEQIFQLDRIAWQPDTFLERVVLKLEQKYLVIVKLFAALSSEKGDACVMPRNERFYYFPLLW